MKPGDQVAKACPLCGPASRLVIRENRETGNQFLGCPHWPDCNYTEPIPEEIRMIAAGASKLPGF
nr:topoisomerase DNA-binding C4 zinc finger domain-containing protein [Anaerolineae bacterium]